MVFNIVEIQNIGLDLLGISARILSELQEGRTRLHGDKKEIVTKADITIEDAVIDYIKQNKIPANIDGEEKRRTKIVENPELLIVLDPLDGTYRYSRNFLPHSTIVTIYDTPNPRKIGGAVFTGVYDHETNRLWYTSKGREVILQKSEKSTEVKTSGIKSLTTDTSGMVDHGPCTNLEDFLRFTQLYQKSWVTNISSAGVHLASVSSGNYSGTDFYVCWKQKPEELVSGILLVENAGGIVTDFEGNALRNKPYDFNARYETIAAATPELAEEIRKNILSKEKAKELSKLF